MRTLLVRGTLLAALALTGCTGVFSPKPIGESPFALAPEEWEGTWTDSQDFLEIRVIDAESGRIEAAWIETRDDGFGLERVEVLIRQTGDALFGNAIENSEEKENAEEAETRYAFFRIGRDGEKLVVWWPSVEAFKAAVEEGTLPGVVTEGGDVVLGDLGPEHQAVLAADESAVLFSWKEPGTLFRPGGP
jgi:hypothetical protein